MVSRTVATPIIDKNGKRTTVHRKVEQYRPTARLMTPRPQPIPDSPAIAKYTELFRKLDELDVAKETILTLDQKEAVERIAHLGIRREREAAGVHLCIYTSASQGGLWCLNEVKDPTAICFAHQKEMGVTIDEALDQARGITRTGVHTEINGERQWLCGKPTDVVITTMADSIITHKSNEPWKPFVKDEGLWAAPNDEEPPEELIQSPDIIALAIARNYVGIGVPRYLDNGRAVEGTIAYRSGAEVNAGLCIYHKSQWSDYYNLDYQVDEDQIGRFIGSPSLTE